LKDVFLRIGKINTGEGFDFIPAPQIYNYRNKITLHSAKIAGEICFGYIGSDGKNLIKVENCAIAKKELNDLLSKCYAEGDKFEKAAPDDVLTLRFSPNDGAARWMSGEKPRTGLMTEKTIIGDIAVPAESFFQINLESANLLFAKIAKLIGGIRPGNVLDLYCGSGIFALIAAMSGAGKATGIERDAFAVESAKLNARRLGIMSASFTAAPVEKAADKILRSCDLNETLLILDPPRIGINEVLLRTILRHKPKNMIYISCSPGTMARDLKTLLAGGYEIMEIFCADFFPRTAHFETVVILGKK
jgi:tRNA/tmRNA/rRNA uracil-C5-methylase (TrmA/RlmC/RlmD family)